jgi:hypothetical protein
MFLSEKIIKIFSCALFEILYVLKEVNIKRGKSSKGQGARVRARDKSREHGKREA